MSAAARRRLLNSAAAAAAAASAPFCPPPIVARTVALGSVAPLRARSLTNLNFSRPPQSVSRCSLLPQIHRHSVSVNPSPLGVPPPH